MTAIEKPVRVVLQQPALAKYRIPVFRELAARPGIDLTVLYGKEANLENVAPDGFHAIEVPQRELRLLGQSALWHGAQLQAADPARADVAILSWNTRYLSLVPALLAARRRGVPTILWGHGYSRSEKSWKLAMRRRIARLGTALLFYESRSAEAIVHAGRPADEVFVAPNCIDQQPIQRAREQWQNDAEALAKFRHEHDLQNRRLLLHVSRMQPANRLDLLLSATACLVPRFDNLLVTIIGSGSEERQRLERQAAELQVDQHFRFLGPVYDEGDLAPWFLSADAFVYPVNIGLSLMHALGYGLPVVTSNAIEKQNPEIVAHEHGVNGLTYADGNPQALADALAQLLADEQLRQQLSRGALATVEGEYNVPQMVDGFVAAIGYAVQHGSKLGGGAASA